MPKVSIVIPTYNRARFLPKAIQSALGQPFADLEVILVDDGSTDDTRQVVASFTDPRLMYVYQENQGATAAFNAGLARATGTYVSILGSDDWYEPGGLARLARVLDASAEVGLAAGGYTFVDAHGAVIQKARPWVGAPVLDVTAWLYGCPVLLQAALIRRSWIERVGGFDPAIPSIQDWDFGLRLARAGCRMAWVHEPIFCYRIHGNQIMSNTAATGAELLVMLDRFFADPTVPEDAWALREDVYAAAYLNRAVRAYWAGRTADARADLERSVALSPALLAERGQRIFEGIVGWAVSPLTADPIGYVTRTFDQLPATAPALRRRRREAIAQAAVERFFHAYAVRDWPAVRRMFWVAVTHDRRWLRNRGVWSILLRMLASTRGAGAVTGMARYATA